MFWQQEIADYIIYLSTQTFVDIFLYYENFVEDFLNIVEQWAGKQKRSESI